MKLPRFSLRTLLVAVAVVAAACAWFAYHWRWIQRREAARAWVLEHHGMLRTESGTEVETRPSGKPTLLKGVKIGEPVIEQNAPFSLRLLGEKSVYFIRVFSFGADEEPPADLTDFDNRVFELKRLFPEAEVFKDRDRAPVTYR